MKEILFYIFIPLVVVIYVEIAHWILYGKNYILNPPPKPLSEDERAKEIDSFKKISNEIMERNITMLNKDITSIDKEQFNSLNIVRNDTKNINIAVEDIAPYVSDLKVSEYKGYIFKALEFYKNNS